MVEIQKNARVSSCTGCGKDITSKYKVYLYIYGGKKYYLHLSCYYPQLEKELKKLKELKRQFNKYKNIMAMEKL